DSILITGNDYSSTGDIKKRMYSRTRTLWRAIKGDRRTRIQRETYARDTLAIKYLYLSNGFLGVQVEETFEVLEPDSSALVQVRIDEGRRFFYGDVKLTGSFEKRLSPALHKRTNRLEAGRPINLFDLHDAAFNMKTVLANEGYPYARVEFRADTVGAHSAAGITFHIESDSLVYFGDVRIEGMNRYPEYVARRELKIKPGEVYRRREILNSQSRLIESGYFSTMSLTRADTIGNRLRPDFVLRVRERKPYYVSVKTGVGQSEVRDLTWAFSSGVGKRNFLGSRRLDLLADYEFGFGRDTRLLTHSYRLRFTEPWFIGLRMPLSLTAGWEPRLKDPVQNFRIETWSIALSTHKNFGPEIRTTLGAEYEGVNIFDIP
ncbi:MAG: POTRA domain-containing protein, partial [Candidatus Zixiibacteriota bacterium]